VFYDAETEFLSIGTCTPIARQRVGKQVPLLGYEAITEAVFSIGSAPSNSRIAGLCNPFLSNGWVNTFPRTGPCYESGDVISNRDGVFRGVCAECL
jgi:hypothetical protein